MCFWGVFWDLLDGKMELHAFEIIWRCVFGACVFGFGGRQDGLREGGRVCEERGEEMRAPSKHGRRLGLHLLQCPRPRQAQHPNQRGRRRRLGCTCHMSDCRRAAAAPNPTRKTNQRGRRLVAHVKLLLRRGRGPLNTHLSADADWGCACRAVALPRTRQSQTRAPVSVDADWGCTARAVALPRPRHTQTRTQSACTPTGVAHVTCRAVVVPRKTQHAPRSAWTPTGVAHVGLLPCSAKPNTHPVQRGRCCAAAAPHRPHPSISPQQHRPCTRIAHHWANHKPCGLRQKKETPNTTYPIHRTKQT